MRDRAKFLVEPVATPSLTVTPPGQVVSSLILGQPIQFFVANPRDVIQKVHARGQFYEPEELDIIRRYCPHGAVFCDIGSNVGNHAIFALRFLHAARVIVFEPNPIAISILMANLGLNGLLDRCDTSHLGIGLSDRTEGGKTIHAKGRNLGGARILDATEPGEGSITLRRGDEVLADVTPDFIKIDVEGMEMAVLNGLTALLTRCQPTFFIEVDNANRAEFLDWVTGNNYEIRDRFRRYRANENFLIVPRRIQAAGAQVSTGADGGPVETGPEVADARS